MTSTSTKTNVQKYGFEPTDRERDLYNKQKENMYKGTFYVCLAYGLAAVALLLLGAFTDWGREYIYGKMLPATATFVIGALIIIIYLSATIYSLKPKQLTTKQDSDGKIICPDYWKLQKVSDDEKTLLSRKYNQLQSASNRSDTMEPTDPRIQYKCVMDNKSTISRDKVISNNELYKHKAFKNGFTAITPTGARLPSNPDYIFVEKDSANGINVDRTLHEYAEVSGLYGYTGPNDAKFTVTDAISNDASPYDYANKKPLKCNEVIPGILEDIDKNAKETNKYRCLYAETCDIPWTDMNCKYKMDEI